MRTVWQTIAALALSVSSAAWGQELGGHGQSSGLAEKLADPWPLEYLILKKTDSPRLGGLLRNHNAGGFDFVEVHQPAGRPMYLIARRWPAEAVIRVDRLPKDQRRELADQIERFIHRSALENDAIQSLDLKQIEHDGRKWWSYHGSWFVLECAGEEELARRAALYLENVFAAYRELWPAKHMSSTPIRVLLFSSVASYQETLAAHRVHVENPAVYLPEENLLIAGSDFTKIEQQFAKVYEKQRAARNEYRVLAARARILLDELDKDLTTKKKSSQERKRIVGTARTQFERALSQLNNRIEAAQRQNQAEWNQTTQALFARLGHEAFHVYLENYLFPESGRQVPRWLNEGLAQLFEEGQVEGSVMRLDSPGKQRIAALAADIQSNHPLSLVDVIDGDDVYLFGHARVATKSNRHYLYAWGLAYYLTFNLNLLDTPQLERYLLSTDAPSQQRFEQLVGMRLPEFEQRWRDEMTALAKTGVGF